MTNNNTYSMKEGITKYSKKTALVKGHIYDSFFVYVPKNIALDSSFPFVPGDEIKIIVDGKKRLIIEKV